MGLNTMYIWITLYDDWMNDTTMLCAMTETALLCEYSTVSSIMELLKRELCSVIVVIQYRSLNDNLQ